MYVAFHDQTSSAHNRSWGQALHVAESGVHEAIAYLQNSSGVVPSTTQTGTTGEGTYQYRIVAQPRNRYQIDAVGTVGNTGTLQASRRLRVTMAPPIVVQVRPVLLVRRHAEEQHNVCGDVYAGTYVDVCNNDAVHRADESVVPEPDGGERERHRVDGVQSMGNNSVVEGTVWSGGYNSRVGISNGGSIGGDAKASSSTPGCARRSRPPKYKISGGTVAGNATAWGAITSTVSGTKSQSTCTQASASAVDAGVHLQCRATTRPRRSTRTTSTRRRLRGVQQRTSARTSRKPVGHLLHHRRWLHLPGDPRTASP